MRKESRSSRMIASAPARVYVPGGRGCLCVSLTAVSPALEEWLPHSRC